MSQRIVILGATSKIAQEYARLAAEAGKEILLVGRRPERLSAVAGDLAARGAKSVSTISVNLADIAIHTALVDEIVARMPDFETVFLAYGSLSNQVRAEHEAEYAIDELTTNLTSAVSLLTRLSNVLVERQREGCVAAITSVAGDRARRSNYIYGTAKGGLSLFLQGLRAKLLTARIRVLTIKPGPVATPMTADMPKRNQFANPQAVALAIYREIENGRRDILYVPRYWRWVMMAIQHIPEHIGKRIRF